MFYSDTYVKAFLIPKQNYSKLSNISFNETLKPIIKLIIIIGWNLNQLKDIILI